MPGEGAGALLVGAADRQGRRTGLHRHRLRPRDRRTSTVASRLRADGLDRKRSRARSPTPAAQMHDMDFRITDNSGEQYYFKEAALALSRTLRKRKESSTSGTRPSAPAKLGATAGVAVIATGRRPPAARATRRGRTFLRTLANDARPARRGVAAAIGRRHEQRGLRQQHGGVVQSRRQASPSARFRTSA